MSRCYLCDRPFDRHETVDHREHIIQNSIGGLLSVPGILCQSCGAKLGSGVDTGIERALRSLCAVFDIRFDRDRRFAAPAEVVLKQGLVLEPPTSGFVFEHRVGPRPGGPTVVRDDAAKIAHVLVEPEMMERFAKSKTIVNLLSSGYDLRLDTDVACLIERLTLRVDCESLDLDRGLIKIALGYARHNGVDRELLEHLLMANSDVVRDPALIRRAVLPYYPTGWGEGLYEAERYRTDDFPPNHQLLLFSHGPRLFCYIDLFGVIQRYVLLTGKWNGPDIRVRYVQRCPKWIYEEADGRPRRAKDIHLLAREFGVETSDLSFDEVARRVRHLATTRPYSLPPSDHLAKPGRMLELLILATGVAREHSVTRSVWRRAAIADAEFGLDITEAVGDDRFRALGVLAEHDPEDFRITNENGFCPDLSAEIDTPRLKAYRDFRLRQFSQTYAEPWSVEAA